MEPCPVAASAAVAPLVDGPPQAIRVAALTSRAVYFTTRDPAHPVLCLATPDAVRLPCALVLGPGRSPGDLALLGDLAQDGFVGGGMLRIGGLTARVGRWWRPPRPRGLGRMPVRAVVDALTARVPDPLDRAGRAAVYRLVTALVRGEPPAEPVGGLLGRGPGLTPLGDDVLAGALVALAGLGARVVAERLGAVVTAAAPARTTAVSAALLCHAARGECVPELANLLTAARDGDPLDAALDALLRVGHTSGAGLVHGVLAALATV
jgi:hypothetical protein